MIDIILLVILGGSVLLGLIRGLVGTLISTAAWLLAGWVTFQFGGELAFWLSDDGMPTLTERFGGYALSFITVMVGVSLVGALAKSMVQSVGLSGVDRLLGAGLGLLRGAFLACLLVLLLGFTPLPREPAWQQSAVLPWLLHLACWPAGPETRKNVATAVAAANTKLTGKKPDARALIVANAPAIIAEAISAFC